MKKILLPFLFLSSIFPVSFSLLPSFTEQDTVNNVQRLQKMVDQKKFSAVFSDLQKSFLSEKKLLDFAASFEEHLSHVNVSTQCSDFFKDFFNSTNKGGDKTWISAMLDSLGRPAPGVMEGATAWVGDYHECLATNINVSGKVSSPQHCLMNFDLAIAGLPPQLAPKFGICFTRNCNESDIQQMFQAALSTLSKIPKMSVLSNVSVSASCRHGVDRPLASVDVFFLTLLAVLGLLLLLGTVYDFLVNDLKLLESEPEFSVLGDEAGAGAERHVQEAKNGDETRVTTQLQGWGEFLLCFSVLTNGRKILSLAPSQGSVACVNGIRFLSLTWVILGHIYILYITSLKNVVDVFQTLPKRWTFQPVYNGTFSVDSFFVLSGFLTAYLFFKSEGKVKENPKKIPLKICMMYLHRYLRLTPALALAIGFNMVVIPYLADGPMTWICPVSQKGLCDKWWSVVLYINNFVHGGKFCLGHTWYLANDMQFFVFAPIFLYAMKYNQIVGCFVAGITMVGHWCCRGILGYQGKASIDPFGQGQGVDNFDNIYIKPYTRIGPYLVGLLFGYLLYMHQKEKTKICKKLIAVLWMVFTAMGLAVIYGDSHYSIDGVIPSVAVNVIYTTFARTAWGLAVGWVTYACAMGYGGPVNSILSWAPLAPLSRINYCAYLFHIMAMSVIFNNLQTPLYYTDSLWATMYLGALVLIYGVAFLTSLAFEAPFMGLEKLLFRGQKKNER